MKTGLLLILLTALGIVGIKVFNHKEPIPEAVIAAMANKYPNAENLKWEVENAEYEAEFILGNAKMSAVFMADGLWTESEANVTLTEVPRKVIQLVNRNYPNAKIIETETIQRPNMPLSYEIEIEINGSEKELLIKLDQLEASIEKISVEEDENSDH